jgi:phasin family protein
MQSLAAAKSPTEFIELQQRLIKEGVQAAVSDGQHIAQLTTAVFTAAFEPVKRQVDNILAVDPLPLLLRFVPRRAPTQPF